MTHREMVPGPLLGLMILTFIGTIISVVVGVFSKEIGDAMLIGFAYIFFTLIFLQIVWLITIAFLECDRAGKIALTFGILGIILLSISATQVNTTVTAVTAIMALYALGGALVYYIGRDG